MSDIYNKLTTSGQAYLYVFVDPKAVLNDTIMSKRIQQLGQLNQLYQGDQTYTPTQMIEILRAGIIAKYGKTPELILQIIYDNAVRLGANAKIGDVLDTSALTFDSESNQYYDGSGNAFVLGGSGEVVSKNGQSTDLTIEKPATVDDIVVTKPSETKHTFWDDVSSVVTWIVNLFKSLGITQPTVSTYTPGSTDWSKLNSASMLSGSSITDYLPYVAAAGIVYYLMTSKKKSK